RDPQSREQHDVYFRVAEEPEQVLEEYRAPSYVGQRLATDVDVRKEKARAEAAVKYEKQRRREQHREREQSYDRGKEESPDRERKPRERHAPCTQVDNRRDVVDPTEQRTDNEQRHGDKPQRHAHPRPLNGLGQRAQRWIDRPSSSSRSCADEERGEHDRAGHEKEPVREHVDEARGHVARSYLQGNKEIAEGPAQSGRQHKEDHDRAVHGNEGEVELRIDFSVRGNPIAQERPEPTHVHVGETELQAKDYRKNSAEQRPCHTRDEVLLSNYLMVFTED